MTDESVWGNFIVAHGPHVMVEGWVLLSAQHRPAQVGIEDLQPGIVAFTAKALADAAKPKINMIKKFVFLM